MSDNNGIAAGVRPPPVAALADIEAIKQLKSRYFQYVDGKKFEEVGLLFAPDASWDLEGIVERDPASGLVTTPGLADVFKTKDRAVLKGRKVMADFIKFMLSPVTSIHHGYTPDITILSETEARGIWPMEDYFYAAEPPHAMIRHGYGHYDETYVKIDGAWMIASINLSFVQEDRP